MDRSFLLGLNLRARAGCGPAAEEGEGECHVSGSYVGVVMESSVVCIHLLYMIQIFQ